MKKTAAEIHWNELPYIFIVTCMLKHLFLLVFTTKLIMYESTDMGVDEKRKRRERMFVVLTILTSS